MFTDLKVPLVEYGAFQGYARLRRCLVLAVILCISLWFMSLNLGRETPARSPIWAGFADQKWLSNGDTESAHRGRSKVGKVTMAYGRPNAVYERTLASHRRHATQHGYPMFVLKEQLLNGVWSKLVYVMTLVSMELQKPPAERLEWLLWVSSNGHKRWLIYHSWHDADTYILNPNVPLETFLPPNDSAFGNVSFLVANDHVGLQAGTFLLRVDSWAVELLSAAIALPRYRPDMYLKLAEQTALEYLVDPRTDAVSVLGLIGEDDGADYFHRRSVAVPQRWFNAYLGRRHWDGTPLPVPSRPVRNATYGVEEGDLLIHSSGYGVSKFEGMTAFIDNVERDPERWAKPLSQTGLTEEAEVFWQHWKASHISAPGNEV